MSSAHQPTTRFSNRVADYLRARPRYPHQVLDLLRADAGLTESAGIADVGSGTGFSSELFLKNGNTVFGVEPNKEMREAAESLLIDYSNFHSVDGSAEATTLADASIDMIVAGQAFHWFDADRARTEFQRILRNNGPVVLLWNTLQENASPFMRAYMKLLDEFGTDFRQVVHTNVDAAKLKAFFGGGYEKRTAPNEQQFDFEGLRSRVLSSSYMPAADHPRFDVMMKDLERIFAEHQESGDVRMVYLTKVYFGRLN